jgi:uncharacterized protein YbjT (DUF2867 family)
VCRSAHETARHRVYTAIEESFMAKVAVFGASGVQGRMQVHELLAQGHAPRAITRTAGAYADPRYAGLEIAAADYDDPASLDAALAGVDAVFGQPFSMGDEDMLVRQMNALADALVRAKVPLFVFNTSMWAPRSPCGVRGYDVILEMEQIFEARDLAVIFFEPTLFMNNLQGSWIRDQIANHGKFTYCHKPEMEADWICLEDVARYMVAALSHPDLAGRKIRIGGPERLKAKDVVAILAEAVGRPVVHEYITPRDFAQGLWDLYKDLDEYEANGGNLPRGKSEEQYVGDIDRFYSFCNDSPLRPFLIDQAELERTLSVPRTTMRQWALAQDWH